MGVFLNLLGMSCKKLLLLMMLGIVVQLHNPGVAGLPSAYSDEHLPILYTEEPWYKNNHPAHLAPGQLVTGYLIPGHLMPVIVIIETVRNVIRPGTLSIRLAANIVA